MKRGLLGVGLAAVFAAAPASAATLYVGHGINAPGGLPVDICLVAEAGTVTLFSGVTFDTFASVNDELGVDELDAGRYDVEVRLTGVPAGAAECEGTVAAAASIFLGLGENATALAHLTEQGTPTITKYVNDFRSLRDGKARIYARHAAAAGDVDVVIARSYKKKVVIRGLENPDQEGADLPAGEWRVKIFPAHSSYHSHYKWRHPLFGAELTLEEGTGYFAYAVGSPADGSFTVILQPLPIN